MINHESNCPEIELQFSGAATKAIAEHGKGINNIIHLPYLNLCYYMSFKLIHDKSLYLSIIVVVVSVSTPTKLNSITAGYYHYYFLYLQ